MFFMGGMTMGYLHPPLRVKETETISNAAEEKPGVSRSFGERPSHNDGAIERTLLWARRILC